MTSPGEEQSKGGRMTHDGFANIPGNVFLSCDYTKTARY